MARVIHRRKSPPYLLIVFVFLFLVSAALAVIAFNKLQDEKKANAQTTAVIEVLAGDKDGQGGYPMLKAGLAAELYKLKKEQRDKDIKESKKFESPVLQDLVNRERALREFVSNTAATETQARKLVEDLRKDPSIKAYGLVEVIKEKLQEIKNLEQQKKDEEKARLAAEGKRKEFEDLANGLQNKLQKLTEDKAKEIAALDTQFKTYQADQEKKFQDAQQKWADDRTDKDKQIAKLAEQVARLTKDKTQLALENEILKSKTSPRPQAPPLGNVALQPDGKILQVLPGENVCYIDIGSRDRVIPGLTFGVYPVGRGPNTDTPPKGNITVTNVVDAGLSECRIDKIVDSHDPVVAGDAIANVAFDAVRQYTFVVEGQFDLYGGNRPTALGTKQVKDLITKFRGEVANEITPQTDFVVMGTAAVRPSKPAEGAPESELAIYEEQMKVFNRYQQVQDNAAKMKIPVLNANRFLALIGYTPKKTLK